MTSAHCLDDLSGSDFRVEYFDPELGKRTVWNGPLAYGTHPDYGGWVCYPEWGCDGMDHDLGYLHNPYGTWIDTNYLDYVRIYQDDAARIVWVQFWGAGFSTFEQTGHGTLRHKNFPVEDYDSWVLSTTPDVSDANFCQGDSGGPQMKLVDDLRLLAAVNSAYVPNPVHGECGWGDQWGTRTNEAHLTWLASETGMSCASLRTSNYDYKRCFDIPFINEVAQEGYSRGEAAAMTVAAL